jgi:hypothetical protein
MLALVSWFWVPFFLFLALHVLAQAWAAIRSQANGVNGVGAWLAITWPVVLVRGGISALFFAAWLEMPDMFAKIAGLVFPGNTSLPLNDVTSGLFGFLVDEGLDKIFAILGMSANIPKASPPLNP